MDLACSLKVQGALPRLGAGLPSLFPGLAVGRALRDLHMLVCRRERLRWPQRGRCLLRPCKGQPRRALAVSSPRAARRSSSASKRCARPLTLCSDVRVRQRPAVLARPSRGDRPERRVAHGGPSRRRLGSPQAAGQRTARAPSTFLSLLTPPRILKAGRQRSDARDRSVSACA